MQRRVVLGALPLLAVLPSRPARPVTPWHDLARGAVVALVRHATAPGVGDPVDMRLGDCRTQRNLDAAGRDEARALGDRLRRAGIARARLYSSRWCRCLETATLLDLGPVEPRPALDSFFAERRHAAERTAQLSALIADAPADGATILVTHQVNITALTGVVPAPAEMVLVERHAPHAVRSRVR